MATHRTPQKHHAVHARTALAGFAAFAGTASFVFALLDIQSHHPPIEYRRGAMAPSTALPVVFDRAAYDRKLEEMANDPPQATSTATSTPRLWPVRAVYPNAGAILPFKRVVAYYGNFYAKGMGVLGEYPHDEMLRRLRAEVARWSAADPATPAVPAIDYIAVTAQEGAGSDGKYRARMPDDQIDHALDLALEIDGIVILDVQVGLSNVQTELPLLEKYLSMPQVHLALDPEFSMKSGARPGREIGTFDAVDINYAAQYLARLVREHGLPPKILVVHRFTQDMITHYRQIKPLSEVQIVMDMDGWGSPAKKFGTYARFIAAEPVQFTGFKLFYKNDLRAPSTRMFAPNDLLKLSPRPVFIQYQ